MLHALYTRYSMRLSKAFSLWNQLAESLNTGKTPYPREILYAEMPAKYDGTGKQPHNEA